MFIFLEPVKQNNSRYVWPIADSPPPLPPVYADLNR